MAAECTACPKGSFCIEASVNPVECPNGTYANDTGTEMLGPGDYPACRPCDGGMFCEAGMTTAPDLFNNPCPRGHYCPEAVSYPIVCPPGTYNPVTGLAAAAECLDCPPGAYCTQGSITPRGSCVEGYYCPLASTGPQQVACPAGTFNNRTDGQNITACANCPKGFYCGLATAEPELCPMGSYCPVRSSLPEPCPSGRYGNAFGLTAYTECVLCDGGSYCDVPGLTSPAGNTDPGYYSYNGASSSTPGDAIVRGTCPSGHYCPAASVHPISCPNGTFNNLTGSVDDLACTSCTPGYYCGAAGLSEVSGECAEGYYCNGSAASAFQHMTPEGFFSARGASQPLPCAAGTFNRLPGQPDCEACPSGSYCPTQGTAEPVPCPRGHFCLNNTIVPALCPAGSFQNFTGSDSCRECLSHGYCPEGTEEVVMCPKGYEPDENVTSLRTSVADACAACLPGTASALGECCDVCANGTYTDLPAQHACLSCEPGHVCHNGQIGPAPPGHYAAAGFALPCPLYTYRSGWAVALSCDAAPPGYWVNTTGVADLSGYACPLGHFCPENSTSVPTPCAAGRFRDEPGASSADACELCTAGSLCERPGTIVPAPCDVIGFCPAGSSSAQLCPLGFANANQTVLRTSVNDSCTICPVGSFGPDGIQCFVCGNGTYTAAEGEHGCTVCEQGYACEGGLRLLSPPGFYGKDGAAVACPRFTVGELAAVRLSCPPSPAGYFVDEPGVHNLSGFECPLAHYCPANGTESPVPCPAGTLRDQPGAMALSECPPCPEGYYCGDNATVVALACSSMGYCEDGAVRPNSCPEGYEANRSVIETNRISADVARQICQPSTASSGGADCQTCPNGTYTLITGEDTCHACEDGFVCVGGGRGPAPLGHFGAAGRAIPCPLYTYNNAEAVVVECELSPPGYFVDELGVFDISRFECPVGSFCPSNGTSLPVPCPAGRLRVTPGAAFLADCSPCPAGFYCPTNGTVVATPCSAIGFCPAGSAQPVICPLGHANRNTTASIYRTSVNDSCTPCAPFSYGPDGITCETCADGFYTDTHGATHCTPCEPGYVCVNGSRGLPQPGNYAVAGASFPCPVFTFNDRTAVTPACAPSPPGYFINSTSAANLTGFECPLGHFCALNGTTTPQPCPAGTMNAQPAAMELGACLPCPAGRSCRADGTVVPEQCEPPFYCVTGTVEPQRCPRGFEAVNATLNRTSIADSCLICPPTTYSALGLSCLRCSNGTYTNVSGADHCTACEPGYVCEAGRRSLAPAGHFAMYGRLAACPLYTFNPAEGVVPVCQPSPPGYFINATRVADLSRYACRLGHFCPSFATEAPVQCPAGTLRDSPGAAVVTDCDPCPAGFYCPSAGTITPVPCTNEGYCATGSTEPAGCPRGYKWDDLNAGSSRVSVETGCEICSPGTYGDGERCIICPEASICAQFGMEYPGECSIGHFCNNGSTVETPCPAGSFNNETSSHCKPCPAGTFSNEDGRSACKPCSASAFSVPGAQICHCMGAHRVFQPSDSTCICEPGYVAFSSSEGLLKQMPPDQDGLEDCQPITYARCPAGQVMASSGECTTSAAFCAEECAVTGVGELDARTGVCNCAGLPLLEEVCNASCRATSHHTIDQGDDLRIHGLRLEDFAGVEVTGTAVTCDDQPACNVVGCLTDASGIACGYHLEDALPVLASASGRSTASVSARHMLSSASFDTLSPGLIPQPILCLGKGDYVLFDVSDGHSLVYIKDSLLNTNAGLRLRRFPQPAPPHADQRRPAASLRLPLYSDRRLRAGAGQPHFATDDHLCPPHGPGLPAARANSAQVLAGPHRAGLHQAWPAALPARLDAAGRALGRALRSHLPPAPPSPALRMHDRAEPPPALSQSQPLATR